MSCALFGRMIRAFLSADGTGRTAIVEHAERVSGIEPESEPGDTIPCPPPPPEEDIEPAAGDVVIASDRADWSPVDRLRHGGAL